MTDLRRIKRRTKNKELEYEEAPSGYVTLYNYKEPFMKFNEGYGFQGVLLFDGISDKIQCHFCGKWFDSLGSHLSREHNMTALQYKEQTGLMKTTALINEKVRASLISSGMKKRLKNLKSQKGKKRSKHTQELISAALKKRSIEMRNKTGTCPEQLLDRLKKAYYKSDGRLSTKKDLGRSTYENLQRTYGSLEAACKLVNLPYRKPGQTWKSEKNAINTKEAAIYFFREFFDKKNKFPEPSYPLPVSLKSKLKSGEWNRKDIEQEALALDGQYNKGQSKLIRFTKENLIKFLRNFEKVHGRRPSYSDCKRGLLPNLSRYSYNFGSWKKALQLAFE